MRSCHHLLRTPPSVPRRICPATRAGRAAAERFCQVAGDLGADAARDAAGDDLARCEAPAARVVGAEDAANEGAEAAENAATGAGLRRSLPAFGRRRSRRGVWTRFCRIS